MRFFCFLTLLSLTFHGSVGTQTLHAESLSWTWHNPLPQGNQLSSVAAGDDFIVAAGPRGTVLRSEDGENWTPVDSGITSTVFAAASGGGGIVLGSFGFLLSSENGSDWTKTLDEPEVTIHGIASSEGTWIAAGDIWNSAESRMDGVLFRSSDGSNWERMEPEAATDMRVYGAVGGSQGRFFVTGGNGPGWSDGVILGSTDAGETWSVVPDVPETPFLDVHWNGEVFSGAGRDGTVAFSNDGLEWDIRHEQNGLLLQGIHFIDGLWLAAGSLNSESRLLSSTDGHEWSIADPGGRGRLGAITGFKGDFFATGAKGTLLRGAGPLEMEAIGSGTGLPLSGIAHDGDIYVTVGGYEDAASRWSDHWSPARNPGQRVILTSTDLDNWTPRETGGEEPIHDVVYGNGRFVAVGHNGVVLTSEDGLSWNEHDSGLDASLTAVTYGNGLFVAVGHSGAVGFSSDGVSWETPESMPSNASPWFDVAFGAGRFVAVSRSDTMIHATDPATWQDADIETGDYGRILSVTHGSEGFVAVGVTEMHSFHREEGPIVLHSETGTNWSRAGLTASFPFTAVTATPSGYLATGNYFTSIHNESYTSFHKSRDGRKWEEVPALPRPGVLWDFVEVDGTLVGVGDGGGIVSTALEPPILEEIPSSAAAFLGDRFELAVQASDPLGGELSYQWFFEGDALEANERIGGVDTPVLTFASMTSDDAGEYTVRVSNSEASITSPPVAVTVDPLYRVSLAFDGDTPGWGVDRFASIQAAIDAAPGEQRSKIVVEPGTYYETVNLNGRPAILSGTDPGDPEVIAATVLDGSAAEEDSPVIEIAGGEDNRTQIRGLTIQNGSLDDANGGGIFIDTATPVIEHNRILNNSARSGGGIFVDGTGFDSAEALIIRHNEIRGNSATRGGGLYVTETDNVLVGENRFLHNHAGSFGGGIRARDVSNFRTEHCILYGNTANASAAAYIEDHSSFGTESVFVHNIVSKNESLVGTFKSGRETHEAPTVLVTDNVAIRYNNFWRNTIQDPENDPLPYHRDGNTAFDPFFVDPDNGNFRLRSRAGRWDPDIGDWVTDDEHSPLIAAGALGNDGTRPNLGVYGRSDTASRPLDEPVVSLAAAWPGNLNKVEDRSLPVVLGRTGPLDEALPVAVARSGDAEADVDFAVSGEFTGFAPGEATATIDLTPLPADSVRGDRTVSFAMESSDSFVSGAEHETSIPVYDHPYHAWVVRNFPEEAWDDGTVVAPLAEGGDSTLTNLERMAFAFEGEPDRFSNRPRPLPMVEAPEEDGGDGKTFLRLRFTRPVPHSGIEYFLETSDDLATWGGLISENEAGENVTAEPSPDGRTETVTWETRDLSLSTDPWRFLRITVRMTEPSAIPEAP